MKKKAVICLSILFVLIIITIVILLSNKGKNTFYLEEKYYGANNMTEIKIDELNQLIEKKESFAVFIYQPMCATSSDFESVLSDFIKDKQINIYKIAFSNIKDTEIGKSVKYYPSFIIYNKGEIIDFLEANKDEDVSYYTSKDGFEEWFTKYIKLRDNSVNSPNNNNNNSSKPTKEENNIVKEVKLDNVVKEDNKVNIYFFLGNGCPHCEEEFKFFESIKEKYGKYYNLYTFETWYNEENAKLVQTFAESMGDKIKGVPYTIIGEKSFSGFGESSKNNFISAIESQSKNGYDVYFDKIKK